MSTIDVVPVLYFPRRAGEPPEPVPFLLTAPEAVRFLRLDESGVENPEETLTYYRKQGTLKATQVGRCVRYRMPDLLDFLAKAKELNPR